MDSKACGVKVIGGKGGAGRTLASVEGSAVGCVGSSWQAQTPLELWFAGSGHEPQARGPRRTASAPHATAARSRAANGEPQRAGAERGLDVVRWDWSAVTDGAGAPAGLVWRPRRAAAADRRGKLQQGPTARGAAYGVAGDTAAAGDVPAKHNNSSDVALNWRPPQASSPALPLPQHDSAFSPSQCGHGHSIRSFPAQPHTHTPPTRSPCPDPSPPPPTLPPCTQVLDEKETTVYKRALEVTYQLKMQASRAVFSLVNSAFATMPFTLRALLDEAAAQKTELKVRRRRRGEGAGKRMEQGGERGRGQGRKEGAVGRQGMKIGTGA